MRKRRSGTTRASMRTRGDSAPRLLLEYGSWQRFCTSFGWAAEGNSAAFSFLIQRRNDGRRALYDDRA